MIFLELLFVVLSFACCFIAIAEIIYWLYKKEYLKAKAKYLREVIDQKNDSNALNESFYACVYEKWDAGEMPLTEAAASCQMKFNTN